MSNRHLNYLEILNVILCSSHFLCISNFKVLTNGRNTSVTILIWQARAAPDVTLFVSGRFWPQFLSNENIDETYVCGQKWPNHGTRGESELTRQLICAQMVAQKQLCSPFCCVLSRRFPKNCRLGKALQRCAWRYLNCTWKFHLIVGWIVSARGTAKPSTTKWFLQLPPEYIWERRLSKIRLIKIRFLNILMTIII